MAEKITLKNNPPTPQRESKRKKQKKELDEDFVDISRGNAFLFMGRKKKPPVEKVVKKPPVEKVVKKTPIQQNQQEPLKSAGKKEAKTVKNAVKGEKKAVKTGGDKAKKNAALHQTETGNPVENPVKTVPKKRKIDVEELEVEAGEEENFAMSFQNSPPKRSQSPQHIKLKLPMSTIARKLCIYLLFPGNHAFVQSCLDERTG